MCARSFRTRALLDSPICFPLSICRAWLPAVALVSVGRDYMKTASAIYPGCMAGLRAHARLWLLSWPGDLDKARPAVEAFRDRMRTCHFARTCVASWQGTGAPPSPGSPELDVLGRVQTQSTTQQSPRCQNSIPYQGCACMLHDCPVVALYMFWLHFRGTHPGLTYPNGQLIYLTHFSCCLSRST